MKVESIQEKVLPKIMKFANSKIIIAIKDGIITTMPLTLIGSIFLLIANFPFPSQAGWNAIMTGAFGANWAEPLNQVSGCTFDIMALVAVFGIASQYAKNEGCDSISAGILGLVSFLIITPSYVPFKGGDKFGGVALKTADKVGGIIPKGWTGGKGMITAILVGLIAGYVYSWFIKRDIRIKLPEGVPEGVVNAFASLIPGAVLITGSMLVYIALKVATGGTFVEWIYKVLQIPLQGITDSLGGAMAIPFAVSFLWWFGIHGSNLVGGVMSSILQANGLANQDVVKTGAKLIASGAGKNAHIVTQQFMDQYITFGGAGMTLGLVIAMLFFAKSQRLKTLSKLSIVPGMFNINEPILFGFTIVLNPFMAIPFVLVPLFSGIITYFAIYSGLVPCFTAVQVPWTTPPIISGFIVAGWRGAALQILLILMAAVVYLPFFKSQDAQYVKEELSSASIENGVNVEE